MAQRFGGKFSPDASGKAPRGPDAARPERQAPPPPNWNAKRVSRAGARNNVLFFLPIPFAINAFRGDTIDLVLNLSAFGLLILAAWLTREGVIAQDAYDARKVARRPAIPRKMFGAVLTGLGLAVGGFAPDASLINPVVYGVLGAVLHFFAFGPDPMKDKGLEGIDNFQTERVARAVDEAEGHLVEMLEILRHVGDRVLLAKMEGFQAHARDMFRAVEDDPRNLTAARRYLGVYLLGARDATEKFADVYARSQDAAARADYAALLDDLNSNFNARTQALLSNDRTALDVEMEVLRDRLAREGVRPE